MSAATVGLGCDCCRDSDGRLLLRTEEILGEGAIDVSQLSEAAQKRRAKAQAHVEECDAAVAEAEAALAELKEEVGCLDQISTRDARGDRPYAPTTIHACTCIWSQTSLHEHAHP